jgi:hypothetical protein
MERIGDKSVSKGCYAASLDSTGRGSSRSFLTSEQTDDMIPPDVEHQLRLVGAQLIPATRPDGTPASIQVTGSTLIRKERSAQYFRDQRELQANNAEFWNDYGVFLEERRKFAEAMDAYERAVALDPSNARAILRQKSVTRIGGTRAPRRRYVPPPGHPELGRR